MFDDGDFMVQREVFQPNLVSMKAIDETRAIRTVLATTSAINGGLSDGEVNLRRGRGGGTRTPGRRVFNLLGDGAKPQFQSFGRPSVMVWGRRNRRTETI